MRAAEGSMIFKTITAIFYISWIFIGNFILLNLFLAILIGAFAEVDDELGDDEDDEEAMAIAGAKRKKLLDAEKSKRMKKLGTTRAALKRAKTSFSKVQETIKIKKKKKQRASFTGNNRLREEDLDDIDDMDPDYIRKLLVDKKILKPLEEDRKNDKELSENEIECDNSIYLFNRNTCFRKYIYFI